MISNRSLNNKFVTLLFDEIKKFANFVKIEGSEGYGRGGTHLKAINLKDVNKVTLECISKVYSDNSGGNRCITKASGVDFSHEETGVFVVDGEKIETKVPREYLQNWADAYWNNKL